MVLTDTCLGWYCRFMKNFTMAAVTNRFLGMDPTGRPGYVVDHVVALKHGGTDSPSNMQWQTKEAAKAKDKVE